MPSENWKCVVSVFFFSQDSGFQSNVVQRKKNLFQHCTALVVGNDDVTSS